MNRLRLEMLELTGEAAVIEVKLRRDTTEFWYRERLYGAFDREMLQRWLTYPEGVLVVDDVTLQLSTRGILVSLDGAARNRVLEPTRLSRLREHLAVDGQEPTAGQLLPRHA